MKITKKTNLGNLANLFNLCNKILSFGSQMKPTNLYLMTLIAIYIFGHFGPQMQASILHSENHGLFCQNGHEITKNHLIEYQMADLKWQDFEISKSTQFL